MNFVAETNNTTTNSEVDSFERGPARTKDGGVKDRKPLVFSSPMLDRVVIKLKYSVATTKFKRDDAAKWAERDTIADQLKKLGYTVSKKKLDFDSPTRREKGSSIAVKLLVLSITDGTSITAKIECNPVQQIRNTVFTEFQQKDHNKKTNFLPKESVHIKEMTKQMSSWIDQQLSRIESEITSVMPDARRYYLQIPELEICSDFYDCDTKQLVQRHNKLTRDNREVSDSNIALLAGKHEDAGLHFYEKADGQARLELKLSNDIIKKHTTSAFDKFTNGEVFDFQDTIDDLVSRYYDDQFNEMFDDEDSIPDDELSVETWARLFEKVVSKHALDIATIHISAGQINFGDKFKSAKTKFNKIGLTINLGGGTYKFHSYDKCKQIIQDLQDTPAKTESKTQKNLQTVNTNDINHLILNIETITWDQRLHLIASLLEDAAHNLQKLTLTTQSLASK